MVFSCIIDEKSKWFLRSLSAEETQWQANIILRSFNELRRWPWIYIYKNKRIRNAQTPTRQDKPQSAMVASDWLPIALQADVVFTTKGAREMINLNKLGFWVLDGAATDWLKCWFMSVFAGLLF